MLQITHEGRKLIREALGSSLYRPCTKVTLPVLKALAPKRRKLTKQQYDRLLDLAADVLRAGTFSKFEFEGPCRNGLRRHLVTEGWRFGEAERLADEIVGKGLNIIGAVRPSPWEAQLDYTYEGLISRDHCKNCNGKIPEDRFGGTLPKYCCDECGNAFRLRMRKLSHDKMSQAERWIALAAKSEKTRRERSGDCESCGKFFTAAIAGRRFCSLECSWEGARIVKDRACAHCERVFRPRQQTKAGKFCSSECLAASWDAARVEAECEGCGARFMRQKLSDVRRFCSVKCASRNRLSRQSGTRFQCEEIT